MQTQRTSICGSGNHDVKNDHGNLFDAYFGSRNFRFEYGNALFIVIDTARGGGMMNNQNGCGVCWSHVVPASFTFSCSCINYRYHVMRWRRFIDQIDKRLARILEDDGVDYVFSGHWHEKRQKQWRETIFIVNGRMMILMPQSRRPFFLQSYTSRWAFNWRSACRASARL